MPNENEITAIDTTFNPEWFDFVEEDNVDAINALNRINEDTIDVDSNEAAINSLENLSDSNLGGAYYRNLGMDMFGGDSLVGEEGPQGLIPDIEVSESAMDNIAPAIAIGAGEFITRAGKGFDIPAGVSAKLRAGGPRGVAFTLATRGYAFGRDFARNQLGMTETASAAVGGGASIGAWKGLPSLINHIGSNVKLGMATEVLDEVVEEAVRGVSKEVFEQGAAMGAKRASTTVAAELLSKEAKKEMVKQTSEVMKERMGKAAAEGWDDVAKRLMNPTVSQRVGRYLGSFHKKLAARLAVSTTATIIPEGVSTVLGIGGLMWTAYDIFNLSKQMPELYALIFEEDPKIEDSVMDGLASDPDIFSEDEAPQIQVD